jgi:hypothetical protein
MYFKRHSSANRGQQLQGPFLTSPLLSLVAVSLLALSIDLQNRRSRQAYKYSSRAGSANFILYESEIARTTLTKAFAPENLNVPFATPRWIQTERGSLSPPCNFPYDFGYCQVPGHSCQRVYYLSHSPGSAVSGGLRCARCSASTVHVVVVQSTTGSL